MNIYVEAIKRIEPLPNSNSSIDYAQLSQVAREFAEGKYKVAPWGGPFFPHFPTDHGTFVEFMGVGNAINFCFSNPETGEKFKIENPQEDSESPTISGSVAMWACLKRALDEGIPILDPDFLANLTITNVEQIFATPKKYPSLPMLHERLAHLRNVGETLMSDKTPFSSFSELVQQSGVESPHAFTNHGTGIVQELLTYFESYQDTKNVPESPAMTATFAKRAQLLALMYQGRALSSEGKLAPLADPHTIGPIADYQVPKTLRILGILVYGSALARLVDQEKALKEGGSQEFGIRINTVKAVARLLEEINEFRLHSGKDTITMVELDFVLWKTGVGETKAKHHLTRTTAY